MKMRMTATYLLLFNICVNVIVSCEKLRYQGDEIIVEDSKDLSKSMQNSWNSDTNKLWHGGILEFYLDRSFSDDEKEDIRKAMKTMENQLAAGCLTFHEITDKKPTQQSFLDIQPGDSCGSEVGRQINRGNIIHLNPTTNCIKPGVIMHEIMHSLGARHEHNRPDRDVFVKVNMENVKPDNKIDFKIQDDSWKTFKTPYDFYSVMSYHENNVHAINPKLSTIDTIISFPDDHHRKEKTELSPTDIVEISRAYGCDITTETKKSYEEYVAKLYNSMYKTVENYISDYAWDDCQLILTFMEDLIMEVSRDKHEIFKLKLDLARSKMDSKKAMWLVDSKLNEQAELIKQQNNILTTQTENVRQDVFRYNNEMKTMNASNMRKLQTFWRKMERTLNQRSAGNTYKYFDFPGLGHRNSTSYRQIYS